MRVRVSSVSQSGLKVDGQLLLEPLNDRINQGDSAGIVFLERPVVKLILNAAAHGATLIGTVTFKFQQPCSLCCDTLTEVSTIDINWILKPKAEDQADVGEAGDDIGVVTYSGDELDLEEPLQEAILLSLSPVLRPKVEDDQCTRCERVCREVVWSDDQVSPEKPRVSNNLAELIKVAAGKKGRLN